MIGDIDDNESRYIEAVETISKLMSVYNSNGWYTIKQVTWPHLSQNRQVFRKKRRPEMRSKKKVWIIQYLQGNRNGSGFKFYFFLNVRREKCLGGIKVYHPTKNITKFEFSNFNFELLCFVLKAEFLLCHCVTFICSLHFWASDFIRLLDLITWPLSASSHWWTIGKVKEAYKYKKQIRTRMVCKNLLVTLENTLKPRSV